MVREVLHQDGQRSVLTRRKEHGIAHLFGLEVTERRTRHDYNLVVEFHAAVSML